MARLMRINGIKAHVLLEVPDDDRLHPFRQPARRVRIGVYDAVNKIVFIGGHSWPGGVRSPSAHSDVPVTDFDADACGWNFFNQ